MYKTQDYRDFLKSEFESRKALRVSYSLSSFAADIGLLPSRLSDIMNGKQGLSEKRAQDIASRLHFDKQKTEIFLNLVVAKHARNRTAKQLAQAKLDAMIAQPDVILTEEQFSKISDWHFFALLELTSQYRSWSDVSKMAQDLGLTEPVVRSSLGFLLELKLLEVDSNGQFTRKKFHIATSQDVPSQAIQRYHKQILEQAIVALDIQDVTKRDYASLNVWLTSSDVQDLKKMLFEFRRSVMKKFGPHKEGASLHALNLNLFPHKRG